MNGHTTHSTNPQSSIEAQLALAPETQESTVLPTESVDTTVYDQSTMDALLESLIWGPGASLDPGAPLTPQEGWESFLFGSTTNDGPGSEAALPPPIATEAAVTFPNGDPSGTLPTPTTPQGVGPINVRSSPPVSPTPFALHLPPLPSAPSGQSNATPPSRTSPDVSALASMSASIVATDQPAPPRPAPRQKKADNNRGYWELACPARAASAGPRRFLRPHGALCTASTAATVGAKGPFHRPSCGLCLAFAAGAVGNERPSSSRPSSRDLS
ncbi:hypothetical protein HDU96_008808 [Phlyctochytrium bullatum]|nr:hypothetical protein HDU96_008808 [Phlyctochytrium bullatum]